VHGGQPLFCPAADCLLAGQPCVLPGLVVLLLLPVPKYLILFRMSEGMLLVCLFPSSFTPTGYTPRAVVLLQKEFVTG
jgi:hypothetical protein